MIGRTKPLLNTKAATDLFLESSNKLGAAIGRDKLGESMLTIDMLYVEFRCSPSINIVLTRYEASTLC